MSKQPNRFKNIGVATQIIKKALAEIDAAVPDIQYAVVIHQPSTKSGGGGSVNYCNSKSASLKMSLDHLVSKYHEPPVTDEDLDAHMAQVNGVSVVQQQIMDDWD